MGAQECPEPWNGPLRHGRHRHGQVVGACGSLHRNLISGYSKDLTATLIRCVDCIMGGFFLQCLICRDLLAPWQTQFQICVHDIAYKTLACVLSTTTHIICVTPLPLLSLFPYKKMLFYTSLVLSRSLNAPPRNPNINRDNVTAQSFTSLLALKTVNAQV